MAYDEITALLGGWPGFEIRAVERALGGTPSGAPQITIELAALPEAARYCSRCGHRTTQVHDVTVRRVRDLPILDADTWLLLPQARVNCPTCGPTIEALPWLDRYARMTKRFAESVARLAQVLPIKQVAEWFGLSWDTVQAIDRVSLEARLGPIDLANVRRIAIDEFAIQKGHRYATVVVDPETRRVLWVGRGRRREDLRPFFELLGPAGCEALEVAVMDMSESYELETRQYCPQVAIVYDLFHVVAKFGREVIDRVRVDETNRIARAAGPNDQRTRAHRRVIKGTRWLLLRNKQTLRPKGPSPSERSPCCQSASVGGLRAQRRVERAVVIPVRRRRCPRLDRVVRLGSSESHLSARHVCAESQTQTARDPSALPLSVAHQCARRHQQQN